MWIKLISPRVTMRPMDSAWKTQMSPPLSLLVLAALTPRRHCVTLEDENAETIRLNDHPDLVGITVKVDTVYRAAAIARLYRERGIPVVVGGIHPTVCPDDCSPFADAVAVGEAETTWPLIVEDAEHGRMKPIYRNTGPVDISTVPVPRWELLREKSYLFTNTLCIGRGCPWRCDFCYNSSPNIDARYRMKPVENILEEIRSVGVRHIMFIDDNFIGDPAPARILLAKLCEMEITWHAAVSADIGRHDDLLDRMAESGCKSLFIGFESVNQRNLLNCHKRQNRIERYDETIAKIHQRGIMVNASLVFGFDGDDESTFPATLDWLVRNRVASMTSHILTPYPGTRLYQQFLAEGRIIDHDLNHYNTAHAVFAPRRMTPRQLEHGYRWIYGQFYSWANIFRRWPETSTQAIAFLEFNLLYRKFGKITCILGKMFGMRNLSKLAKAMAYPARAPEPTRARDLVRQEGTT